MSTSGDNPLSADDATLDASEQAEPSSAPEAPQVETSQTTGNEQPPPLSVPVPDASIPGPSTEADPPPADDASQPQKKRRNPVPVPVENEKSMRTERVGWAPPLKAKDMQTRPPPGVFLRRAAQKSRQTKSRSPSVQSASSSRAQGSTRNARDGQPVPPRRESPSGQQPATGVRTSDQAAVAPQALPPHQQFNFTLQPMSGPMASGTHHEQLAAAAAAQQQQQQFAAQQQQQFATQFLQQFAAAAAASQQQQQQIAAAHYDQQLAAAAAQQQQQFAMRYQQLAAAAAAAQQQFAPPPQQHPPLQLMHYVPPAQPQQFAPQFALGPQQPPIQQVLRPPQQLGQLPPQQPQEVPPPHPQRAAPPPPQHVAPQPPPIQVAPPPQQQPLQIIHYVPPGQPQPQDFAPVPPAPQQAAPPPLQQAAPPPLQEIAPPSPQEVAPQQVAPSQQELAPDPKRPREFRDPRRRRRRDLNEDQDESMGEVEDDEEMEDSGLDDEAYYEADEELQEEEEVQMTEGQPVNQSSRRSVDNMMRGTTPLMSPPQGGPRSARLEDESNENEPGRQSEDGELSYYILDQLNDMKEENRAHNNALMQRMDKVDKRIARIEHSGSTSMTVLVKKKLKNSRAPKASRSKQSRIELPPPPDGKPRTAAETEALIGVELEYLNRAQRVVRMHFKKLLRAKSWEQMAEKCPPLAASEIAAYNKWPNDKEYFCPNNFRVDFSQPWNTFPFNVDARDYFIRHLLHALGGGAYPQDKFSFPERYRTEFHLGAALDVHMEHCRARIRRVNNPLDPDAQAEEAQKARARARRGTLHATRVGVVVDCDYDEHLDLITKLTAVNHSEDETDVDMPRRRTRANRFRIIACEWMSEELRGFLRALDKQYIDEWETSPARRRAGGSAPRERVIAVPPLSELGHAAIGLWRNCYNEAWLGTLKRHQIRQLCILEGKYDFTIRPRQANMI
ncbi:hypothetical protein L226DRAFT_558372 [Lentinus tigrinus ALCF2SS1-7]|uniref:uncharacterized protein n=1 Tax=Lentinus tigrinus ALCF2SS1-7 TaxID=1328758 RepID=UPI0011661BEF|nr:hypothetical protein L226DRAFT_558372 [Lentinus tigrinus ALCF2SS1-7]